MRRILLIFLLLFSCSLAWTQSKTIQVLRDSNLVQMGLYFTPSTLRMINISRAKAFDKLIRGVKKMNLFIMKPNEFTADHYYDTVDKLLTKEDYEEYIIMENTHYELQVLGNAKKQEMVGLSKYGGSYYLFDLKGTIDLTKLPELYENISSQDSTANNGFSFVFDMIKKEEERMQYRDERRRKREKRSRKKRRK